MDENTKNELISDLKSIKNEIDEIIKLCYDKRKRKKEFYLEHITYLVKETRELLKKYQSFKIKESDEDYKVFSFIDKISDWFSNGLISFNFESIKDIPVI